jgi:glycosyltransferase involved in cell wall biosynthesis
MLNGNPRRTTIFLNCGKWEKRKGHDVLVEAFNKAFNHSDDVELWMMCDNPFIGNVNDQWRSLYKDSKLGNKIRIIPRQETQEDVYKIMCLSDCGVFPSRGEGWNLEVLEMMSCGKNVITTNYSAHTEFCNNNNSKLIEIDNLETAFDGLFFDGKCGLWAEFADNQLDQLIEHMKEIHRKKQDNDLYANLSGIETSKQLSWKKSAEELVNACRV